MDFVDKMSTYTTDITDINHFTGITTHVKPLGLALRRTIDIRVPRYASQSAPIHLTQTATSYVIDNDDQKYTKL